MLTPPSSHTATAVNKDLKAFRIEHKWDPNLPDEDIAVVSNALESGDLEKKVAVEVHLLEEDSPYPEVRAAVRSFDNGDNANTVRAWVIGILWATIGSGVNMLFSLRNPSISLTPVVTLLLSYPFGVAWTYGEQLVPPR